jgi:hypothetical protein
MPQRSDKVLLQCEEVECARKAAPFTAKREALAQAVLKQGEMQGVALALEL